MTVLENVLIGLGNHGKAEVFASFFRLPAFYKNEESLKTKAIELLKIFDLDGDVDTLAKNLPYGQQRRLEIVRALATEPKILFLDEPAAGMNPQETAELTQLIRKIKEEFNITIMLIEHDMSLVMEVTERIYVLEYGRLIAHGTPAEIRSNKRVIEAYLGGEA
jgi:branched-chain amino acid transport system ATP-binding protein